MADRLRQTIPGRERPLTSTTQPNTIEVDDFSFGWAPDPDPSALPVGALTDALNLIPEPGTDIPKTRFGFTRLETQTFSREDIFYDGLTSVDVVHPGGFDPARGLFNGLYDLNAQDQAAGAPPDTGIVWGSGNRQVAFSTRVRNYSAQGQGSADYSLRIYNVTDSVLVAALDVSRDPLVPTDYSDTLTFSALAGKAYQAQVVYIGVNNRPVAILSYEESLADIAPAGPIVADSDYYISQLFDFNTDTPYLIAIVSNGIDDVPDNVQVWAIELDTGNAHRVDDAGRPWFHANETHWGFGIQDVWYGGSREEEMYSWDWRADSWNPQASINPDWKTWTDLSNDDVDLDSEWPVDYAWNGKERALYDGGTGEALYVPTEDIRYVSWTRPAHYVVGDRVSRLPSAPWDSVNVYWKSFLCIKEHDSTVANAPGSGVDTDTYWRAVFLTAPATRDGVVATNWDIVPKAAKTGHAAWFAQRLWLRYDDASDNRLQFSAPLKLGKVTNTDLIGALDFDPTDFAPGNDINGDGGGWIDFEEGDHHNPITAIQAYGQYLVVFKRQSTWVLTGLSEDSFQVRKLALDKGCLGQWAVVEHEGLLYFLDEDGLKLTDGTSVEAVPGLENAREWFKNRLHGLLGRVVPGDDSTTLELTGDQRLTLQSYHDFVVVSMFSPYDDEQNVTVFYHPLNKSFWKTDLPIQSSTHAVATTGDDTLYFSTTPGYGYPFVYSYEYDADHTVLYTDDTGTFTAGTRDVPWRMTTAFWPFGIVHEQRRIRSVWAVVRGDVDYTIDVSVDWDPRVVASVTRSPSDPHPTHIEGVVVQPDPRSIAFGVSGEEGPASIIGIATSTQPRRIRYHS